jgi:hypothetical protein|tara:strand:- start:309 stop:770 length:462 start_codon:yes stop_codon:yes gene_type:complete
MAIQFLQILGAVGSVLSVASTVAAGDAARQQAESKAREAEEDRKRNALKFAQMHNDRLDKYFSDRAINNANLFGGTGRDKGTDRSLKAFRRKQEETVGKDVTRMDRQALFTDDKSRRQAEQFRIEGEAKQRAYYLRAVSQGIQGFYNMNKTSV